MLDSETFWYVCEDVTVKQTDKTRIYFYKNAVSTG